MWGDRANLNNVVVFNVFKHFKSYNLFTVGNANTVGINS